MALFSQYYKMEFISKEKSGGGEGKERRTYGFLLSFAPRDFSINNTLQYTERKPFPTDM